MDYQIIQLSDVEIAKLTLVKESISTVNEQDHSRWVFRGKFRSANGSSRTNYIKIWNPQYVRRDNVPIALEAGFYDNSTVPALTALIYHDNICRGYVTEACKLTHQFDANYYETLKRKTIESGFFAIQYSRYHIGLWKGRFSLFDLEGVHPIRELSQMPTLCSFFDDEDYGRFVTSHFLTVYPNRSNNLDALEFLRRSSWRSKLSRYANQYRSFCWFRVRQFRARQWIKFKLRPSHAYLIEL